MKEGERGHRDREECGDTGTGGRGREGRGGVGRGGELTVQCS